MHGMRKEGAGAARPGSGSTRPGMDVLVQVASNRYRCHLGKGCEVSPSPRVTPVPGMPPWLTGLILGREQVIPVVDLARVLGVPPAQDVPHLGPGEGPAEPVANRMLTLREAGLCVGFLVEDVRGGPEEGLPALDLGNVASALTDRLRSSLRRTGAAS